MGMGSHHSAGRPTDWITPKWLLERLGTFDLDPCAHPDQPWTTSHKLISPPADGLQEPWAGRVWLNPPYDAHVGKWLERLDQHGHGTALVFARVETRWCFSHVWEGQNSTAALFLRSPRLHFHYPDGTRAPHNCGAPSMLVAYGTGDAKWLWRNRNLGYFVPITRYDHPQGSSA